MSDVAWMFRTAEIPKHAFYMGDPDEKTPKENRITLARNQRGWPLGAEHFFKRTFAEKSKPATPAHFCTIRDGFLLVSPKLVEIFNGFDMGQGAFYPTEFFAKDRMTPLPHQHRYWNLGNQKETFLPNLSRNMTRFEHASKDPDIEQYSASGYLDDDDVALGPDCLQGPDIWAERYVSNVVFLSDSLAARLRAKGMEKDFSRFLRCRIG